jgi:hypothetical protein
MLPTAILSLWFLTALGVGYFQLLRKIPTPAIQGTLLLLTAILLLFFFFLPSFRRWIFRLNLRVLILYHLTRFVGIYFLILYFRGELPYDFAVKGGCGDIAVAALAIPVSFLPFEKKGARTALWIWNIFGLLDILFVVITAARLGLQDPSSVRALTVLPLSLLPTFIVPLIIATHVFIWVRLNKTDLTKHPKK